MPDDAEDVVAHDEVLLRHCPNLPPAFVAPIDYITGKPKIQIAAIRIKEDEDGLSVYREKLLKARGVDCSAVRKSESAYVFAFCASVVRESKWNVFPDPQDEPTAIGYAHALIAVEEGFSYSKAHKESFVELRAKIIAAAEAVVRPAA